MHILVLGDSHAQVWEYIQQTSYKNLYTYDVVRSNGATISGINNPNSKTNTLTKIKSKLENIKKPYDYVMIQLGEVDCGFALWYHAEKHGLSIQQQFDRTIREYKKFIEKNILTKFTSSQIILIGSILPIIDDQSKILKGARSNVSASLNDRKNLILKFNNTLKNWAIEKQYRYIDINSEISDDNYKVDKIYTRDEKTDHHLSSITTAPLWENEIKKIVERDQSMKVFIGYDTREDIAYQVCKHSILNKQPKADIRPLKQQELRDAGWYNRPIDKLASTEFTFTRFLIPELTNFNGWALFMDCDMILKTDIKELFDQTDDKYAVMCVKHDYTPKEGTKMDGQKQTVYPRKNWSSVMLINCGHPSNKKLTMDLVNDQEINGAYLHRFSWLKDEEIGELSNEWNWLVGWYKEPKDGKPRLLHYTEGGPWFENYRDCEYAKDWKLELYDMFEQKS